MSGESIELSNRFLQIDEEDAVEINEELSERTHNLVEASWHEVDDVDMDDLMDDMLYHVCKIVSDENGESDYAEVEDFHEAIESMMGLDVIFMIESDQKV